MVTQAGAVLWNGAPVNLTQLRQYLDVTQQMDPIPELHLQPEPEARYELVDEVLAVTKQAKVIEDGLRRQRSLYDGLLRPARLRRRTRAVPQGAALFRCA